MAVGAISIIKRMDMLRHMLGATQSIKKQDRGYRNHFCAEIGSPDHGTMMEMVSEGLVSEGKKINEGRDQFFHATIQGCEAIGLSKAAIKRAFEE